MAEQGVENGGRGREAIWPWQIPLRGWRDILLRVKEQIRADNLTIVAAGVAFYGFLAVVPLLAAVVSLYGLFSDPADVRAQVQGMEEILPAEVMAILGTELERLAGSPPESLGVGVLVSLLITLWSATRGSRAIVHALNIVYEQKDRRPFLRKHLVAYFTTICSVLLAILVLGLLVFLPLLWRWLGLGAWEAVLNLLRWPLLLVIALFGLGALYRYAPYRKRARSPWVSTGALAATALWLVASWAFSFYVGRIDDLAASFGSIGAVAIFLLWLFLSALSVLLGAELNAEMEHQTAEDTTVGPQKPIGERGAYVADHVGPTP